MLVLELQFPAGRFHATPWGRNVNEGVVEWPPSPYRLARSLVDVCHRRRPDWSDERLGALLKPLAATPAFRLPPATAAHTRSFLSSNTKDPTAKQKVFDAFVVLDRHERLLAAFDCEIPDNVRDDLDDLLGELNYFGRSESWVRARVLESADGAEFNCGPSVAVQSGCRTERVEVACLRSETEYTALPNKPVPRKKGKGRKAGDAGPLPWLDAIRLSTSDLLADGWSEPPAQKMLDLQRPADALKPRPRRRTGPSTSRFRVARYALSSTVLPGITKTVALAERIRSRLMGIHRHVVGGDPAAVSWRFSGKAPDGSPVKGHDHAFLLPLDEDGDGRIDHLMVCASEAFNASELDALDRLRAIWQPHGRPEIKLVLVSLSADLPWKPTTQWVSATPFVTTRHYRKGRGSYLDWLDGELRRECGYHGLPEPVSIEWIDRTQSEGHQFRWMEFLRSRKGDRPLRGHGCVLVFAEPVPGPFALGALCHFGLGSFMPEE